MDTVLEVVEKSFGEPLSPDLIRRIEGCSLQELDAFRLNFRDFTRKATVLTNNKSELRPYVSLCRPGRPERSQFMG